MRVAVLGQSRVLTSDDPGSDRGTVPARKPRSVLAALVLHLGTAVSAHRLVELVWGEKPPHGANGTLQAYVSGLRHSLEPALKAREQPRVLVSAESGYRLLLDRDQVDATRFADEVRDRHRGLAPLGSLLGPQPGAQPGADPGVAWPGRDQVAAHVTALDTALAMWTGEPYADLGEHPDVVAERAALLELAATAEEDRALALLALGEHATVLALTGRLVAAHPLRERVWALHALALTRAGRQNDALSTIRRLRDTLAEELGLDPGHEVRALEEAVLRQDPGLLRALPPAAPALVTVPNPPSASPADSSAGTPPRPAGDGGAAWPMVGRDAELAAAVRALDDATSGRVGFVAVTGDPGIGKSRLCGELVAAARDRGFAVAVGRCSQDDGAPPLWPWSQVFTDLGIDLPVELAADDPGARFRTWHGIAERLVEAAVGEPLLVVLDDLHWADASSLRVLRLLAETATQGHLAVAVTWRHHPAATGALAEAAEALARRHGVRLALEGLDAQAVAEVVGAVAHSTLDSEQAEGLRQRTDGNPFFLVEFARLSADHGRTVGDAAAMEQAPPAVQDVLRRRLSALPPAAQSVLSAAAVVGRDFDVEVTAAVAGHDELDVLDALEPARGAGLVRDAGTDAFRFAHALVRDVLYADLPGVRRARLHARAAEAFGGRAGQGAAEAAHWLRAGPRHAGRAWRAAAAAAAAARTVHAHEEALDLLELAAGAMADDPRATPADRVDLLLALGESARLVGRMTRTSAAAHEAMALARVLGDDDLLARTALMHSEGALWQPSDFGLVDEVTVGALRTVLARLPVADAHRRCRLMLALALEIYYAPGGAERDALVTESLAAARRSGDDYLLLDCLLAAYVARWLPDNAAERLQQVTEAVDLARRLGAGTQLAEALALRASTLGELGRFDELGPAIAGAREAALDRRHLYLDLLLDGLAVGWLAMRGDQTAAEETLAHMAALGDRMDLVQLHQGLAAAMFSVLVWQPGGPALVLRSLEDELARGPAAVFLWPTAALACRSGSCDRARALLEQHGSDLGEPNWHALLRWSFAAETAAHLRDADLGARSYALLTPLAGRPSNAGSGAYIGIVDGYLALAAHAVGERDLATRHADAALDLAVAWKVPPVAQLVCDQRDLFGY
ncbi:MAG TPA: BTAD domain-containing putative transcriptional regulator [Nocardioidaceae bacterium]|nr:BTAD domain-containing putative transcriptional regulator [Nocardioidaceae bacterium]